jgi:hypothetical protein
MVVRPERRGQHVKTRTLECQFPGPHCHIFEPGLDQLWPDSRMADELTMVNQAGATRGVVDGNG